METGVGSVCVKDEVQNTEYTCACNKCEKK